jgi:hypothetical protein
VRVPVTSVVTVGIGEGEEVTVVQAAIPRLRTSDSKRNPEVMGEIMISCGSAVVADKSN